MNKKEINIVWFKRDLRVTDLRTFIYGTATGGLFMNPCRIAKQFNTVSARLYIFQQQAAFVFEELTKIHNIDTVFLIRKQATN